MSTLGAAANFLSGGTPRKGVPEFWNDGDISWYSASNMTHKFIGDDEPKITEAGLADGSRLAPAGSTLLLVRGSGLFKLIPICFADRPVAFNQDVKAICARSHVDPLFLHFWIESLRAVLRENIEVTGIGAGKFDLRFLQNLPFPEMPKDEQERIGCLASSFDRKIELNRRMNETLEAMARAVFKDWFVDFGPTRTKMAMRGEDPGKENVASAPYLAPELWSLFPDRLDKADKPEGWTAGSLADLASLNPESWSRAAYPEFINYVDLANTKWGVIEAVTPFSREAAPSRAQRILRPGDTIVGTVRPGNGSYAFVSTNNLTGSTGFAVLRPKNTFFREATYLAATSKENIDRLSHLADGGAYPAIRPEIVASTELASPPDKVFKAFSAITCALIDRAEANKLESYTLAATRDLLLPKLMSGEVRVKNAEDKIGDVL